MLFNFGGEIYLLTDEYGDTGGERFSGGDSKVLLAGRQCKERGSLYGRGFLLAFKPPGENHFTSSAISPSQSGQSMDVTGSSITGYDQPPLREFGPRR